MEDALDETPATLKEEMPVAIQNGEVSAELPNPVNSEVKVNGKSEEDSSEGDNLIIDEQPQNNNNNNSRKRKLLLLQSPTSKKLKTTEEFEPPTNPYFNESLFELSALHNKNTHSREDVKDSGDEKNKQPLIAEHVGDAVLSEPKKRTIRNKKNKKNSSPKLREYAQYLGLQPTVQFKCSRCAQAGFQSLAVLNEHHKQCRALAPIVTPPFNFSTNNNHSSAPSTNFRVTRKVYLCSACGTYYENWNLYLHMREVHKRFICLYCLGMFSLSDKLSLHLVSKHNCVPNQLDSREDFLRVYSEPCFLMCCDCERVFSERDNFFHHSCVTQTLNNTTGSFTTMAIDHKAIVLNNKSSRQAKTNKSFVEHVTADMPMDEECTDPCMPESEATSKVCGDDFINEVVDQQALTENSVESHMMNDDARLLVGVENNDAVKIDSDASIISKNTDNQVKLKESSPLLLEDRESSDSGERQNEDTRKVPKVTLRLPKPLTANYLEDEEEAEEDEVETDDDSEKLTMNQTASEPSLAIAGEEIPIIELQLEQPLDKFDMKVLLRKCLNATVSTCVYCNHARKIAVNGKQLGLHAIAEHRFSAIVNSITAEELIPESFVMRIRESLTELDNVYFNLESTSEEEGGVTFAHAFECFQCRYSTAIHKELYLHNRKMHAKTILLCIMCKSNFYSYSELICHLCPGLYELNNDVRFRCCVCVGDDLPSAFRLMVHLRKRHHACDVCLELCHNQSRLSNHVWKHKLHHLCYRCGIAYRNKPDITKHLFWKHGTESVLCKKCLQKKWPHVYHFCIPPNNFTCEECSLVFMRAVSLKVHKRLHSNEKPHTCTFENCLERFISKKLLLKHEFKHREPVEELRETKCATNDDDKFDGTKAIGTVDGEVTEHLTNPEGFTELDEPPKPKPKVDVYDLPVLNLSESDSSDSEEENSSRYEKKEEATVEQEIAPRPVLVDSNMAPVGEENVGKDQNGVISDSVIPQPPTLPPILENVWDDFKNYQANKEKTVDVTVDVEEATTSTQQGSLDSDKTKDLVSIVMMDHDYSTLSHRYKEETESEVVEPTQSMDHDYCWAKKEEPPQENDINKREEPAEKKLNHLSSSDSSGSDSSSCTCGSNCSCSSSSDSSSSSSESSASDSSSSEGRRKQQARRERRRQRASKNKASKSSVAVATDGAAAEHQQAPAMTLQAELPIEESDLDTTETETDEDFYDTQPQKLANKLIAEKRKELLLRAGIDPTMNGAVLESSRPSTPSLPDAEAAKPKKRSKNKKKKKKSKRRVSSPHIPSSMVSPITISLPKNSPLTISTFSPLFGAYQDESTIMGPPSNDLLNFPDSSLRASKRRRVPNKFYGYTSDDERDKHQPPVLKWRKADLPSPRPAASCSPLLVPPITIKTIPSVAMVEDPSTVPSPPPRDWKSSEPCPSQPPPSEMLQTIALEANHDSGSESNDSTSEEEVQHLPPAPVPQALFNKGGQAPLYCYCRCPYDEVSEMIGCDSDECIIEWFHFECVGIMVPPKGQWFCPDCRKKKQQQRKELMQT